MLDSVVRWNEEAREERPTGRSNGSTRRHGHLRCEDEMSQWKSQDGHCKLPTVVRLLETESLLLAGQRADHHFLASHSSRSAMVDALFSRLCTRSDRL